MQRKSTRAGHRATLTFPDFYTLLSSLITHGALRMVRTIINLSNEGCIR